MIDSIRPPQLAACYLRVSGDRQTCANQRAEVAALARARGFEPVWYEETESAAKRRPVFDSMLADVKRGKVVAVVVWSLDRLHRSMVGCLNDVLELDRLNVRVISVRESWLDTAGPVRSLLVALFGWVAEFERARLIERTKAGLARAKAEGKRLGRPPRKDREAKLEQVRALRAEGKGYGEIGRQLHLPPRTVARWLGEIACQPTPPKPL